MSNIVINPGLVVCPVNDKYFATGPPLNCEYNPVVLVPETLNVWTSNPLLAIISKYLQYPVTVVGGFSNLQ